MDPTERIRRDLLRTLQSDDTAKLKQILKTLPPREGILAVPLDPSGNHVLAVAVQNAFEEGVDLLLEHGVSVNCGNSWMETALHLAVEQNLNTIVDALLADGRCDVDIQTKNRGETPLHVAARVGNKFAAKELLDCDCSKALLDFERNSPLHLAVKNKRYEITRLLLLAGFDPRAQNSQQKTPIFIAMRELDDKRMKELLVTVRPQAPSQPSRARKEQVSKKPTKWEQAKPRRDPAPSPSRGVFQTEVPERRARPKMAAAQRRDERRRPEVKEEEEVTEEERSPPPRRLVSAGIQAVPDEEEEELPGMPQLSGFEPYIMASRPRGVCLIINNETYWHENFEARSGATVDENRLSSLFHRLQFRVTIHKNMSAADMFWAVTNMAGNTDHSPYDAFVCCILSHGSLGTIYGIDGDVVRISDLTVALTARRCPSLSGKPKMFFIQACRGPDVQGVANGPDSHDAMLAEDVSTMVPDHADFLLAYATVAGFRAQRHREEGSVYMKTLTTYLHAYHSKLDLLSILTKVNAETSKHIFQSPDGVKYKQMPEVRHTLTKPIFLP